MYIFALLKGETQDLLFIATERYKFCVLQWDADANEVLTRFGPRTKLYYSQKHIHSLTNLFIIFIEQWVTCQIE